MHCRDCGLGVNSIGTMDGSLAELQGLCRLPTLSLVYSASSKLYCPPALPGVGLASNLLRFMYCCFGLFWFMFIAVCFFFLLSFCLFFWVCEQVLHKYWLHFPPCLLLFFYSVHVCGANSLWSTALNSFNILLC